MLITSQTHPSNMNSNGDMAYQSTYSLRIIHTHLIKISINGNLTHDMIYKFSKKLVEGDLKY